MNNEIISRWYYGQVREVESIFGIKTLEYQDVNGPESWRWLPCDDFGDESAWTQELFGRIEKAGLQSKFYGEVSVQIGKAPHPYYFIKASPTHKAEALARAIKGAQ